MQDYFKMLYGLGYKRFYNKNEILFFEGEIPKKILVILKGKVRIYKTTQNKEETLHYIESLNFIAEMPSFLQIPYPASAVCMNECEILEIDLEIFKIRKRSSLISVRAIRFHWQRTLRVQN